LRTLTLFGKKNKKGLKEGVRLKGMKIPGSLALYFLRKKTGKGKRVEI